jgi:hypothetical protein
MPTTALQLSFTKGVSCLQGNHTVRHCRKSKEKFPRRTVIGVTVNTGMPKITISTGDSKKTNNKIPAAVFERAMNQKTLSPPRAHP